MDFTALRDEWLWFVIATVVFDLAWKKPTFTPPLLCFKFERAGTVSFQFFSFGLFSFITSILVFIFFFWYLFFHEYWFLKRVSFDLAFAFIASWPFSSYCVFFSCSYFPRSDSDCLRGIDEPDSLANETECCPGGFPIQLVIVGSIMDALFNLQPT